MIIIELRFIGTIPRMAIIIKHLKNLLIFNIMNQKLKSYSVKADEIFLHLMHSVIKRFQHLIILIKFSLKFNHLNTCYLFVTRILPHNDYTQTNWFVVTDFLPNYLYRDAHLCQYSSMDQNLSNSLSFQLSLEIFQESFGKAALFDQLRLII